MGLKKLVVTKTGVGKDSYEWDDVGVTIEYGTLVISDLDGLLIHAYSPGAWLEAEVEES